VLAPADRHTRASVILTRPVVVDRYHEKGMTVSRIAEQTGFHPSTVRSYLHRFDIKIRHSRYHVDPK
jgi:transposase